MRLDFVLNHQGLALVVNLLGELGRDGVVSSSVLHDQTLVALNTLEDGGLLDCPFTDVSPLILGLGILLCVGRLPPRIPAVCELFQEGSFEVGRLAGVKS